MNPLHLLFLIPLLATTDGNPTVVIRADHRQTEWPQALEAYLPAGLLDGSLGLPVASDTSFEKAGGNRPTLHVFGADLRGDGTDEIIVARRRPLQAGYDIQIRAYYPPATPDSSTGRYIASSRKGSVGSPDGDGGILLMGGIDLDGDGKDEAFLIRQWYDGTQTLEIRKLPKKRGHGRMKKLVAMDTSFGLVNVDPNVAACGADVDGDGRDEIVVIRRAVPGGVDRLLVFDPPATLDGETGPPILSDEDITPDNLGSNLGIGRTDTNNDGSDELILRRMYPTLGSRSLEVFNFPSGPGGELGAPLFVEPNLVPNGSSDTITGAFGLRGYTARPPTPPAHLDGVYRAQMSHFADGNPEQMPPLGDLTAPSTSANSFVINMPTFNALVGAYSRADAQIDFGATLNRLKIVGNGDTYWLTYGIAQVSLQGNQVVISGTYAGTKDPLGGPNQAITGGLFSFTRQD